MTTVSLRELQIMVRTGYGRLFSLSRDQEQCCQRQAVSDVLLTDRTGPRRASPPRPDQNCGSGPSDPRLLVTACLVLTAHSNADYASGGYGGGDWGGGDI